MDGLHCCSERQTVLLVEYGLFLTTCFVLWYSRVLFPLKLFTVFLHEFSHATAVWFTCNKVSGIEVNENLGGLTHWSAPQSRVRCAKLVVLPAGYLGSALWGGIILVCCAEPTSTRGVAIALAVAFLITLGYTAFGAHTGHRRYLVALCVFFLILLVGLLYVCFGTRWPYRDILLSTVLLLIAAMNTLFATHDIWEDCVARQVDESDASRFAVLVHWGSPKCIGSLWLFLSVILAIGMLLLTIWRSSGEPALHSPSDISTFSWFLIGSCVGLLILAIVFRVTCSQTYQHRPGVRSRGLKQFDRDCDARDPFDPAADDVEVALVTGTHAAPSWPDDGEGATTSGSASSSDSGDA